ncbi:hypothetical protein GQ54DRAFT_309304 [Martensiomyces pterosporus]|nr:hypothetical protein GQ54DRAFT_309304 [Martensiomyces pterosporus]
MSHTFSRLPSRLLTHIFESLYWEFVHDSNLHVYASLPIGQLHLLPCLHVCRSWRKRAAKLFYKAAVVVVGSGRKSPSAMPAVLSQNSGRSCHLRTNVELLLESGHAAKAKYMVLFSIDHILPADVAIELEISQFSTYEWPGITNVYFHHPQSLKGGASSQWEQDDAIATTNQYLINSLPSLNHICALSNMRDSFGLYSLDDLINAKLPQLRELVALSRASLKLGADVFPQFLTRLNVYGSRGTDAIRIPRTFAASLVHLEIGPITPDNIWGPFMGKDEHASADFTNLRFLRLGFSGQHLLGGANGSKEAKRTSKHYASPGPDNAVTHGAYPLFPRLESLKLEAYPYNIVQFLENFPRSQIRHLELKQCPTEFYDLSLAPFASLSSASIDIPATLSASNQDMVEEWVSHQLAKCSLPDFKTLTLSMRPGLHISLPGHISLTNLRSVSLSIGVQQQDVGRLLRHLPHLRFLELTVTEAKGRTRDYLSRKSQKSKYLKYKVLSKSLERLTVYLYELTRGRQRRTLSKTAWILARVPTILQFRTQREYVQVMRECVDKVLGNKMAPANVDHLRVLQYQVVLE